MIQDNLVIISFWLRVPLIRLTLLAAGFRSASDVVALVGTASPARLASCSREKRLSWPWMQDEGGTDAMRRLAGRMERAGYLVRQCPPVQDRWGKDVRRIGACEYLRKAGEVEGNDL